MGKPTGYLTAWEAMLQFDGQVEAGKPVELTTCFIAAPYMPTRRRVSIEEFESDMKAIRKVSPHGQ